MRILGIETSCDETAAAVVEFASPRGPRFGRSPWSRNIEAQILSNVVHSQIAIHRKTGGVVPEVAAREHAQRIVPVIEAALLPVDVIAVTYGPGLITSLMVGVEAARTLSWLWNVPIVAVNHMEGHIAAAALEEERLAVSIQRLEHGGKPKRYTLNPICYTALALVVSGGHTELVLMKKPLQYQIIGATRDDAAGEAFDKVAKVLRLGYPGGPIVSKLAEAGDPAAFPFSAPMIKSKNYDFSFSGIKTAVLYKVKELGIMNHELGKRDVKGQMSKVKCIQDICASFQKAVVDVLVTKTIRAAKEYNAKTVILAGGVAANKQLRERLAAAVTSESRITNYQLPMPSFCTDNAVMIAIAGYFHALQHEYTAWQKLDVDSNLVLGD